MRTNADVTDGLDNEGANHERASSSKGVDLQETSTAQIAVKTGHAVDLLGKRFALFRPAQCSKSMSGSNSLCGSDDAKLRNLDSSLVGGFIFERQKDLCLYDVAGLATELHGHGYVSGSFFLHAPGVTLRAFKSKDFVRLTGNFAQASVKDSEFFMLILQRGSFVDFDLTGAAVKMLILNANDIDAAGLRIPSSVGCVSFKWIAKSLETNFSTDAANAELVIKAWNSAGACEALAIHLLNRSQKPVNLKILSSKAQTVWGVDRAGGCNSTSNWVCCGLIARRNQLQFRSRLFNVQTKPANVSHSLRSSAADDQRRIA